MSEEQEYSAEEIKDVFVESFLEQVKEAEASSQPSIEVNLADAKVISEKLQELEILQSEGGDPLTH